MAVIGAIVDGNGNPYTVGNPMPAKIGDGVNTASLAQGKNADNQVPQAANWSLDVSSQAGLLNACSNANGVNAGGIDRGRTTSVDGVTGVGIPAGSAQFAVPFGTTLAQVVAGGNSPQTVTVASAANIKVNEFLSVGGANPEQVFVAAVAGNTVTAVFKANHASGDPVSWFHYNVARDAAAGDSIPLTGLSASMTYLWNTYLNIAELDRSAAGELDGASGKGTAVAAEYEWNGGGPTTNTGAITNLAFDRARSLQAKNSGAATLNGAVPAGGTSLTLTAAVGLEAGQQILLDRNTATEEAAYVVPSYAAGALVVGLQSALQFAHATASTVEWDEFGPHGPGLNGFTCAGIGIEEEALYNPVDGKYYIERSATQDAMPAANIVAESSCVFNGTTMDRMRSAVSDAMATTGIAGESEMLWNGTGFDRARSASIGDGQPATGIGADQEYLFNGTTFDRARSAGVGTAAVAATGLQAAVDYVWNGTTFDAAREATADALAVAGVVAEAAMVWNGTTFDRLREATADALPAVGIASENPALWNGTAFDRLRGDATNGAWVNVKSSVALPVTGTFYQATQPVSATQIGTAAALADATANPTVGLLGSLPEVWNGATWDRLKSASAANLSAFTGIGAGITAGPGNWSAASAPAAATVATVTRAAGAAGVRHVCNSITASVACGATAQTPINVYLRDGLTGAGTVLWAGTLAAPANGSGVISLTGLNVVGSTATAMTLEFSAAGVAAGLQAVTLGGYDAQ